MRRIAYRRGVELEGGVSSPHTATYSARRCSGANLQPSRVIWGGGESVSAY